MKALPWEDDSVAPNGRFVKENFSLWFGHSKVVGRDNAPKMVFHGTKAVFESFRVGIETINSGTFGPFTERRMGLFFAEEQAFAETFTVQGNKLKAGCHVLALYLSLQNPLDLTEGFQGLHGSDFDRLMPFIKDNYWAVNLSPDDIWSLFDEGTVGAKDFIKTLQEAGFDGVKMIERNRDSEATDVWVALDPCQVKSARGNSGLYLSGNPSIDDHKEALVIKSAQCAALSIDLLQIQKITDKLFPMNNDIENKNHDLHRASLEATGFWGKAAAGCLFFAKDSGKFLLAQRSEGVLEPGTWSTWGGALDVGESPQEGVRREIYEEAGFDVDVELVPMAVFEHESGFRYHNFIAIVDREFEPQLDSETQSHAWVDIEEITPANFDLHPGMFFLLAKSGQAMHEMAEQARHTKSRCRP